MITLENFSPILKTERIYRAKISGCEFYNNERIRLKTKLTPLKKRCQFVD